MKRIFNEQMKKFYPVFSPYSAVIPPENFCEFICLNCGGAIHRTSRFLNLNVGKICFECIENEFLHGTTESFLTLIGLTKTDIYDLLWVLGIEFENQELEFFD